MFHVELKYTSRGPRLIEVNCRMGGGPVRLTNLLVWGVDLVEEHLLTCAGIPSRPPTAGRPLVHVAEYSINAHKTGVIKSIDYVKVRRHSLTLTARLLLLSSAVQPGSTEQKVADEGAAADERCC